MQNDDATRGGTGVFNGNDLLPPGQATFSTATEQQRRPKPRPKQRAQTRPADGEDNTNRKLLNLPPVVGSCLQYANKSLPYRPFPADVDDVRKKVFLCEKPLLLDSQQIADYWPHVSNLYMRSSRPSTNDNGTVSEAWECRIRRRVTMKGKDKTGGQGLRQRQSKDELLGDVDLCKIRVNLVSYTKHVESQEACGGPGFGNCHCIAEWLYIERTSHIIEGNVQHTHSLELLDMYKRSDALMYFCKLKVEEGQYSYAAVVRWAQEKYGPISSQLQHVTKADVANVARIWRQQNKDLELRSEIVEETDEIKQRKECIDSIHTTSAEQLRKALAEVCKIYPHAVDIIAPFMEKRPDDQDQSKPIAEGNEINIPPPGRPRKRKMGCDPPSPPTTANRPPPAPGAYQPNMQDPHAPSPYTAGFPQPSQTPPNNTVREFRISLPNTSTLITPPAQSTTPRAPQPPPPYPTAPAPPMQFLQYPRPSAAQSSAARIVAQTNGSQRIAVNGSNRPSWAQPTAAVSKSAGSAPPTDREPKVEIDEQLRKELG